MKNKKYKIDKNVDLIIFTLIYLYIIIFTVIFSLFQ